MRGDGGGKVPALGKVITGRVRVAKVLHGFSKVAGRHMGVAGTRVVEVNGEPGVITLDEDGKLINVIAFQFAGGRDPGDRLDRQPREATDTWDRSATCPGESLRNRPRNRLRRNRRRA